MSQISTNKQHQAQAAKAVTVSSQKATQLNDIESVISNEIKILFNGNITYRSMAEADDKIAPVLTAIIFKLTATDQIISNKVATLTTNREKIMFLENYLQTKNYNFSLHIDGFKNKTNEQVYVAYISLNKINSQTTSKLSDYTKKADLMPLEKDVNVIECGENILAKFMQLSEEAMGTGRIFHAGTTKNNNIIIYTKGMEAHSRLMKVPLQTSRDTIIANEMGHIYFNLVMKDALPDDITLSFTYKNGKTYNTNQLSEAFSDLIMLYHISDNPMLFQNTFNQITTQTIQKEGYSFSRSILTTNYSIAMKKLQANNPNAQYIDFNQLVKELLLETRKDILSLMSAIHKKS